MAGAVPRRWFERDVPDLVPARHRAAQDAEDDGISLAVTGGWCDEKHRRWPYDREVDRSVTEGAVGLVGTDRGGAGPQPVPDAADRP